MSNFTTDKGKIFMPDGFIYEPRWFSDGRVAFRANNSQISQIDYYGPKTKGRAVSFVKYLWNGMRVYTVSEQGRTLMRPADCELMPFGFKSKFNGCEYSVFTADDFVFFVVKPGYDCSVSLEFYGEFMLYPHDSVHADYRLKGIERSWDEFKFVDGKLIGGYTEGGEYTAITFSSNCETSFKFTERNEKHIITANNVKCGEECVIGLHFSNDERKDCSNYKELYNAQIKRYDEVAKKAPVLKSNNKYLNQFFELAPYYHESLKVNDIPGAVRAQSAHYWVWGWDSMTSPNCCLYWGDEKFIGDMVALFEEKADPEHGLAHGFFRDMKVQWLAAPSAQSMYFTLLDYYRLAGGDFAKHYPFAKTLLKTVIDTEVGDTGLCNGNSLYPDYFELLHETKNDISAFNNTVAYCGIRSMQDMAHILGDSKTETLTKEFADKLLKNFGDTLFNKEVGFFDSSADATTFEQRSVPSNNAIKWENNYCLDLVEPYLKESLDFYKKHLVSKAGLRPYPVWSDVFDSDANQLSCWWPVMCEFYIRLINKLDCPKLMKQFVGWIEYWTERLTMPEGISCYDDSEEVLFDEWNSQPGTWQAYTIRGFYNAIVHGYVGVDFDKNGINFYPYSGEELDLLNLHFGKYSFDIHMRGSGKSIKTVIFNGQDIGSRMSIPFDNFALNNDITVIRE